jgi:hypothetical protein
MRADFNKLNLIYRVQLVDKKAPTHDGPLDALEYPPPGGVFVESTEGLAAFYWTGHPGGPQEIVTKSRLKVLAVCS